MQLLGRGEVESKFFTRLYPEFQKHSYVSMQHLVLTALEYYVWCSNFYSDNFKEYDASYDTKLFEKALGQHENIYTGVPVS